MWGFTTTEATLILRTQQTLSSLLTRKKPPKSVHDICLNGRNEPLNKFTTGRRNQYIMHSKRKLLQTDLPSPAYAHARESRIKTDFVRELIPIQRTQLLANTRNSRGHKTARTHFKPTETF